MSGDTTVAVSDGFTCTVKLTAKVKQELWDVLRARGVKPNLISICIFVGVIVLAIEDHREVVSGVMIDEEYSGYDEVIKSLLADRMRALGAALSRKEIWVDRIGKKSPAHRAAIRVTREQASADKSPTLTVVC